MRGFPFLCAVLFLATTPGKFVLPAQAQNGTRDSVRVTFKVDAWYTTEGGGYQCGAGLRVEHPDFADTARGYSYNPYDSRVYWYGQYEPGLIVGGISGSWAVGPTNRSCGRYYALAAAQTGQEMWAIYVYPEGVPVAKFDSTGGAGFTVQFDGSDSFEAVDGGKVPVASYQWDFGDGSVGNTSATPSHTYAQAGTYLVTLEVTDDDGQKDSYSRNIHVSEPGLLVWAEAMDAGYDLEKGEGLYIVGYVENHSSDDVSDVVVPLDFLTGTIFPDDVGRGSQATSYTRITSVSRKDTTIAFLSPGERAEIEVYFVVDGYASHAPAENRVPLEVTDYAMLMGVTGKDAQGDTVRVDLKCGYEACGKTWQVRPRIQADTQYRTNNLITFEAKSGVEYNEELRDPALRDFNFNLVQPFTYKFVDGTLTRFCHTSCADFRLELKRESGEPIEGATVVVTAPEIPATANVTPDHSGGHLCKRNLASYTCGKSVTLETDEDGVAEAYYSFPGLVEDVEVNLHVLVKDGSTNMMELTPPIRLKANERTDFVREITLTRSDVAFLTTAITAYVGGAFYNFAGDGCEGIAKWATGGISDFLVRPGQLPVLHQGMNVISEWICTLNPITFLSSATAGNSKKFAETTLIGWFSTRFMAPSGGLGTLNGPFPPPFVFYWDGDYYGALLESIVGNLDYIGVGTRLRLSLHEVSWLQQESIFDGNLHVPNVHFKLELSTASGNKTTVERLLELGYDPAAWLTPPVQERLAEAAAAQADRIRVQETIESIQRGDYVWLDAAGPNAELVQVAEVEAAGGKAATSYTLHLTRPLRTSHEMDAPALIQRDSTEVGPPRRPILLTTDSVATGSPLTLRWANGLYETPYTYDLMVARDTAFTDLLLNLSDLTESIHELDPIQHGEVLYWRARSSNLMGTGEWARHARVVGIDGYGVWTDRLGSIESFTLHVPYPNPARESAIISYGISGTEDVRISVFDVLGREVAVLVEGVRTPGHHTASLETDRLPAGMYFVRMEQGAHVRTRSLVVVR